jgi:hypothetical protein
VKVAGVGGRAVIREPVKEAPKEEVKPPSKFAVWFGDTFGGILLRVGGILCAVALASIYCCGGSMRCYIIAGLGLLAVGVAIYFTP